MRENKRFETEAIHHGYHAIEHQDNLTTPMYQSSTFVFNSAETGEKRFAGEEEGYMYSRLGNPTVSVLEKRIAALENAEAGLAFGSGMAAVSALLFYLTKAGDHIVCSQGIYGCTFGLLEMMRDKFNIEHDMTWMASSEDVENLIQDNTTLIYLETPINPTLKVIDLEMVSRVAKKHNITVVVDNTFSSPYIQRPIDEGCDYVVHSATKYINGHGDVIAGLIAGPREAMDEIRMTTQKNVGGIMSPFDAWLLLRGLKTMPLRIDRHCSNATQIAAKLTEHPQVDRVIYPGHEQSDNDTVAKKQMTQSGGLVSFEVRGGKSEAQAFLNYLKLVNIAVSLGDAETLAEHPATMTHAVVPSEEREKMGIRDNLIRVSVGLEAWEDIWEDIEQALSALS